MKVLMAVAFLILGSISTSSGAPIPQIRGAKQMPVLVQQNERRSLLVREMLDAYFKRRPQLNYWVQRSFEQFFKNLGIDARTPPSLFDKVRGMIGKTCVSAFRSEVSKTAPGVSRTIADVFYAALATDNPIDSTARDHAIQAVNEMPAQTSSDLAHLRMFDIDPLLFRASIFPSEGPYTNTIFSEITVNVEKELQEIARLAPALISPDTSDILLLPQLFTSGRGLATTEFDIIRPGKLNKSIKLRSMDAIGNFKNFIANHIVNEIVTPEVNDTALATRYFSGSLTGVMPVVYEGIKASTTAEYTNVAGDQESDRFSVDLSRLGSKLHLTIENIGKGRTNSLSSMLDRLSSQDHEIVRIENQLRNLNGKIVGTVEYFTNQGRSLVRHFYETGVEALVLKM